MDTYTLLKYFGCKLTPAENAEVEEWILGDTDGSREEKYKSAHTMFVAQKLFLEETDIIKSTRKSGVKRLVRTFARVAAVALIVIISGIWSNVKTLDRMAQETEVISVPAGERVQMWLADGTEMWLNSGTKVEIPVIFSRKERNIKLIEGEILLTVTKDESKPFVVDTWAGEIQVLGTKFDVFADANEEIFSTALLDGSVKITSKIDPKDECILKPNDIATMVDGSLNVARVEDLSSIDSWSSGLIDITDVPFDVLMKKFEKAYDVRVFIDRAELPVISYTRGKIRISDGIDHALSVLQLASDFSYSYDSVTKTVIIR